MSYLSYICLGPPWFGVGLWVRSPAGTRWAWQVHFGPQQYSSLRLSSPKRLLVCSGDVVRDSYDGEQGSCLGRVEGSHVGIQGIRKFFGPGISSNFLSTPGIRSCISRFLSISIVNVVKICICSTSVFKVYSMSEFWFLYILVSINNFDSMSVTLEHIELLQTLWSSDLSLQSVIPFDPKISMYDHCVSPGTKFRVIKNSWISILISLSFLAY
jgi:hypothetical protein